MSLNTMELCAFVIEKYFVVNRNVMIFSKAGYFETVFSNSLARDHSIQASCGLKLRRLKF